MFSRRILRPAFARFDSSIATHPKLSSPTPVQGGRYTLVFGMAKSVTMESRVYIGNFLRNMSQEERKKLPLEIVSALSGFLTRASAMQRFPRDLQHLNNLYEKIDSKIAVGNNCASAFLSLLDTTKIDSYDRETIECFLDCANETNDLETGKRLMGFLSSLSSPKSYISLLALFSKTRQHDLVDELMKRYKSEGHSSTHATILAHAKAMIRLGDTFSSIQIMSKMNLSCGTSPSIIDYNELVWEMISSGYIEDAVEFSEILEEDDLFPTPNSETNALKITSLNLLGPFEGAFRHFDARSSYVLSTNIPSGILGPFGRNCIKNGFFEIGLDVFERWAPHDLHLFNEIALIPSLSSKVANIRNWVELRWRSMVESQSLLIDG
jgi:hypothetical protein